MNSLFFYTQEEVNRYGLELTIKLQSALLSCYKNPMQENLDKAWQFLVSHPLLVTYPSEIDRVPLYTARAELTSFLLNSQMTFSCTWKNLPEKPSRMGVYMQYVSASTESRATLPFVKAMKEYGFEIVLFFPENSDCSSEFAKQCFSPADILCPLTGDIAAQVQTMRSYDLHGLFFANNTTAVLNNAFLLAMHRIAPVQMAHFCQPHSTFIPHMDGFILGENLPIDFNKNPFSEDIIFVPGSGVRFAPLEEKLSLSQEWTLSCLGIPEDAQVYVSGANLYKLSPVARETFVRLLAKDYETYLLLYPFGPSWSTEYPAEEFIFSMRNLFQKYGVDMNRCRILPTLKTHGDILAVLSLCTMYLDSFPHSGATSLLDPLSVNLPCVCFEGNSLISTQGAGLLKELGLNDFVANNEDDYIHKARKWIENKVLYDDCRSRIEKAMANCKTYIYNDMTLALGQGIEACYSKHYKQHLEK